MPSHFTPSNGRCFSVWGLQLVPIFHACLSCIPYTYSYSPGDPPIVDEHTLRLKLSLQQQSVFQAVHVCPRSCPSQGSTICTYAHWFHRLAHAPAVPVVDLHLSFRKLSLFLRFRCGCHQLPSNLGRRLSVARPDRLCPKCAGSFCDEFHLVFQCPFLDPIRAQFEHLVHDRCTMRQFMWHQTWWVWQTLCTAPCMPFYLLKVVAVLLCAFWRLLCD